MPHPVHLSSGRKDTSALSRHFAAVGVDLHGAAQMTLVQEPQEGQGAARSSRGSWFAQMLASSASMRMGTARSYTFFARQRATSKLAARRRRFWHGSAGRPATPCSRCRCSGDSLRGWTRTMWWGVGVPRLERVLVPGESVAAEIEQIDLHRRQFYLPGIQSGPGSDHGFHDEAEGPRLPLRGGGNRRADIFLSSTS